VTLMTDTEIRAAITSGAIAIGPLDDEQLQPASYDLRLGDRAIVTKSVDIEKLRERVESESAPEIDVARASRCGFPRVHSHSS
jgi:deoxycytidine triphosphate deaminase